MHLCIDYWVLDSGFKLEPLENLRQLDSFLDCAHGQEARRRYQEKPRTFSLVLQGQENDGRLYLWSLLGGSREQINEVLGN